MATVVTGEQYKIIDGKMLELKRQIRQPGGYPFDPDQLVQYLQLAVEGKFESCLPSISKRLLEQVGTVSLPAIKIDTGELIKSGKIGDVPVVFGDNFKKVFGNIIEYFIPATALRVHRLMERSPDAPIISELGGEEAVEVKLGQIVEFMRLQGRPKESAWFVFYVRDEQSDLWAVFCFWYFGVGDWDVEAYSASRLRRWAGGVRFLSHDSDPELP